MIWKWFTLEICRVFKGKSVWGWERHEGGEKRENRMYLKICHISPLKLKTHVFHGLPSCEVTLEKCLWSTKFFMGKHYSQDSHELVAKVFAWNSVFSHFALNHFHRKCLVTSFSRKSLWRSFWWKTWKCILKQKLKTRKHKNTFKNI